MRFKRLTASMGSREKCAVDSVRVGGVYYSLYYSLYYSKTTYQIEGSRVFADLLFPQNRGQFGGRKFWFSGPLICLKILEHETLRICVKKTISDTYRPRVNSWVCALQTNFLQHNTCFRNSVFELEAAKRFRPEKLEAANFHPLQPLKIPLLAQNT
jgi:hypothetical protein